MFNNDIITTIVWML